MTHKIPMAQIPGTVRPAPFGGEPSLADLLGDPIASALMAADHVEGRDFEALLATARCHLRRRG